MPRSILFALPKFSVGGAERVAADIVVALHRDGHRTIAVAIERHAADQGDSAEGWFAPYAATHRLNESALPEALHSLIASNGADTLVLAGKSRAYECLPALKARFPSLRVIGFMFNAKQLTWEHRRYSGYIDCVIAESADAARVLNMAGEERMPIRVISSGVDVRKIARRPIVRDVARDLTVAYVGRFDRSKNPGGFVALARRNPAANVHYVMAGSASRSLRTPPHVQLLGLLDGEAKEAFLDRVDILVVPSLNDGRPLIIHEAQARGAVVVASCVGAIPELIDHDVNGLLVEPGDVSSLAAAVARLAGDSALRARLGAAARERALIQGDIGVSMPNYLATILGEDVPVGVPG